MRISIEGLRDRCVGLAQLLSSAMSDDALAEQVDVDSELRAELRTRSNVAVRAMASSGLVPIDIQREIPASWRLRRRTSRHAA